VNLVDRARKRAKDSQCLDARKTPEPVSGREYEEALRELRVKIVNLQQWVRQAGAKVCSPPEPTIAHLSGRASSRPRSGLMRRYMSAPSAS
jgi:hypothetical protein